MGQRVYFVISELNYCTEIQEVKKRIKYLDKVREFPAESARTATAAAAVKAAMAEGVFVEGGRGDADCQKPIPSVEVRSQAHPGTTGGTT